MRTAFEGTFSLNGSDYGIMKFVDGGNGMIGNAVEITLLGEALKLGADGQPKAKPVVQPAPAPATAQPADPARKNGRPELKDMIKGMFN